MKSLITEGNRLSVALFLCLFYHYNEYVARKIVSFGIISATLSPKGPLEQDEVVSLILKSRKDYNRMRNTLFYQNVARDGIEL